MKKKRVTKPAGVIARFKHFMARWQKKRMPHRIRKILVSHEWHNGRHFTYKFDEKHGIVCGLQALPAIDLSEKEKLEQQAKEWMEEMKSLLNGRIVIPGINIGVYYFDRWLFGAENGLLSNSYFYRGDFENFGSVEAGGCKEELHPTDIEQIARLRDFPLSENQYFIHYYSISKKNANEKSDTLCLVQIVDEKIDSSSQKESREVYLDLLRYIITDSPYQQIVIKYQHRHFDEKSKLFTYPIESLLRAV